MLLKKMTLFLVVLLLLGSCRQKTDPMSEKSELPAAQDPTANAAASPSEPAPSGTDATPKESDYTIIDFRGNIRVEEQTAAVGLKFSDLKNIRFSKTSDLLLVLNRQKSNLFIVPSGFNYELASGKPCADGKCNPELRTSIINQGELHPGEEPKIVAVDPAGGKSDVTAPGPQTPSQETPKELGDAKPPFTVLIASGQIYYENTLLKKDFQFSDVLKIRFTRTNNYVMVVDSKESNYVLSPKGYQGDASLAQSCPSSGCELDAIVYIGALKPMMGELPEDLKNMLERPDKNTQMATRLPGVKGIYYYRPVTTNPALMNRAVIESKIQATEVQKTEATEMQKTQVAPSAEIKMNPQLNKAAEVKQPTVIKKQVIRKKDN